MKHIQEVDIKTGAASRKRLIASFLVGTLVLSAWLLPSCAVRPVESREAPPVVIRVDDIQDFAFKEGQKFLFDEGLQNNIPLSLAVIPGAFGEDQEMVEMLKLVTSGNSEVTVHGWMHENLAAFSYEKQLELLGQSQERIVQVLNHSPTILVPPMFSFNKDTLSAMSETGYGIISSFTNSAKPGIISKVRSVPGTVNLSDYGDNTWTMKDRDSLQTEISGSVNKYGFAVIVTHPQEFMVEEELDPGKVQLFQNLVNFLKEGYTISTLSELATRLS
jgi:peptidoglycan/xylan/chitin deacetylase (PgdA/CDA1 family)